MTSREAPSLRQASEADYSTYFSQDRRVKGTWDPEKRAPLPFLGYNTLLCRNCGQFISEKDATQHDEWHRSLEFSDLYRRKIVGRKVA